MTEHPAPRPATDLFVESLKLSYKQRLVLDALQGFAEGAKVDDVAYALGMHPNTARGHLDELVAKNAVRTTRAPAAGRGRPSLLYHVRTPDNRVVANEYVTLIEAMGRYITAHCANDEQRSSAAAEIGTTWAALMEQNQTTVETQAGNATPQGEPRQGHQGDAHPRPARRHNLTQKTLATFLRSLGFDASASTIPTAATPPGGDNVPGNSASDDEEAKVTLRSCPLTHAQDDPATVLCEIHESTIQALVSQEWKHTTLQPRSAPGECTITLRRSSERGTKNSGTDATQQHDRQR